MDLIVDVQGFKGNNGEFIVKELAYLDPNEPAAVPQLVTFQPPFSWYDLPSAIKSINLWLKYSFHGLNWSDGDVPYNKLTEVCSSLLDSSPTRHVIVWVKGAQKKEWMQPYFSNIRNLEELGCPSLKSQGFRPPIVCTHHLPGWKENCAVQNISAIKNWLWTVRQDILYGLYMYEDYYSSDSDSTSTTTLEG